MADIHIQNTAPGPPMATAPATPAMFPVPTVAARAVQSAWNGVIAPSALASFEKTLPKVSFIASPNFLICMNPVRMLRYSPIPRIQTIAGTPHTKLLIAELMLTKVSI